MKKVCLFFALVLTAAVSSFAQGNSLQGYVIAVEGDEVYYDLNETQVSIGDVVTIYSKAEDFVHPVTGKTIRREATAVANLKLIGVYGDYSCSKVSSREAAKIAVGMSVVVGNDASAAGMAANNLAGDADGRVSVYIAPAQVNDIVGIGYFGTYVSDLLMEQLMYCEKVRLLDRSVMGQQMSEMDLVGNYIDPETAIERGKIAGAKYVIQVTMQKPDVVNEKNNIPLASIMGAAQSIAGTNLGAEYMSNTSIANLRAQVSITARVVDLQTGEIVFMSSGTGKAKGKTQLSMEYGALGGAQLNGGAEGFKQTVTGQAIQKAFVSIGRHLNMYFNGETTSRVMGSASGYGNYDDKMERRGKKLYMGTEKLSDDDLKMLLNGRNDLYFKYKSARKQNTWSWVMIVPGCIATGAGIGLWICSNGDFGSRYNTQWFGPEGVAVLAGGIAFTTGGIIMNIKAKKKIQQVADEYNSFNYKKSYSYTPELNLVVPQTGGLGLRLTF